MLRKSKVFDCLKQMCQTVSIKQIMEGYEGVNAANLAAVLQMDRANVSKELNRLVQEKVVVKVIGRPVYYFDAKILQELSKTRLEQYEVTTLKNSIRMQETIGTDAFLHVIGSDGSLKTVIKKAKAAMIYPPFGLHTLLIGPTGVGKTMFAEIMYRYAKEHGVLGEDAKFIVFNCAEYADNPQLLLGQLFGYVKGAYTGAEKTNDGLVEQARDGVLFLDEIHRLPPEGQEMLFMLMDRNEYRRLGAKENSTARTLIIAATTENVESSLLQTFLRRIPMTITMPALHERTIKERYELIEKFFAQEYNQVMIPIQVHNKVMRSLLSYDCKGNIGQLKADIRLLCANGFLESKMKGYDEIRITTSILQDHIYRGLLNAEKMQEIEKNLPLHEEYILYDQTTSEENYDEKFSDIYHEISRKLIGYERRGYSIAEANSFIRRYIEQYMETLSDRITDEHEDMDMLHKIIPIHIYHAVEVALSLAEQRLSCHFSKKICVAMAMHVSAIAEHKRDTYEINDGIYKVMRENPNEYAAAREIRDFLEMELDMKLKDQELLFFTMFLCVEKENEGKHGAIGLLALAHGNGVARNMVDVADSLLHTTHGHALDMSLHQNVDDFLEVVTEKVKEINEGKGVLMLVDMGSLLSFGDIISQKTQIPIRTIDMISTPFVLEALRKTMLLEYTLDDLYKELRSYTPYIGKLYSKNLQQQNGEQYVIITTCMSGEGAAIKLGDLICSALPLVKECSIEIIPCNTETFKQKDLSGKRVLAVVGACDLHIQDVAYISSDKIILEDGFSQLNQIIAMNLGVEGEEIVSANLMTNNFLKETLVFLDPIKADALIRKSFRVISKMLDIDDYNRVLIGYMLHVGCMIERCIRKEEMPYVGMEERIKADEKLYHIIQTALRILEDEFQITISDTEIAYVMDIFDTE